MLALSLLDRRWLPLARHSAAELAPLWCLLLDDPPSSMRDPGG
jgi:hypothetical protein